MPAHTTPNCKLHASTDNSTYTVGELEHELRVAKWTEAELHERRQIAEDAFIEQRMEQGVEDYLEIYYEKGLVVRKFLEQTDDPQVLTVTSLFATPILPRLPAM